jgi:intracellular septation protein A
MMFMLYCQIGIIFLSLHFLKLKVSIIYIAGLLLLGTMSADMAKALIDGNIASLAAF